MARRLSSEGYPLMARKPWNLAVLSGLCAALALLALALVCRPQLFSRHSAADGLPPLRERPLLIQASSRQDLSLPSSRLEAAWRLLDLDEVARWTQLLHILHWQGTDCKLLQRQPPREDLTAYLLDASLAEKKFGRPMHLLTTRGLEFRAWDSVFQQGDMHPNQSLAVLAELGFAQDEVIRMNGSCHTVAEVVHAALATFSWQEDLEWTAAGLAHYLPPLSHWTNQYGETVSFDDICTRLCSKPLGQGNCFGTHVCYALAILLAADAQEPILQEATRRAAHARLVRAAQELSRTQRADGSWPGVWCLSADPAATAPLASVVVAGHSLEWLALAPDDVRVPAPILERGCTFLLTRILEESPSRIAAYYCPYSHAGKALKLWHPTAWRRHVRNRSNLSVERTSGSSPSATK
jgi:hypothetical protein